MAQREESKSLVKNSNTEREITAKDVITNIYIYISFSKRAALFHATFKTCLYDVVSFRAVHASKAIQQT